MLEHRIGFVLDSPGGPVGWLAGADLGHLELQRAQFRRLEQNAFQLDLARAMVVGKIANCRVVLRRYLRLRGDCDTGALDALKAAQREAACAGSLDVLRGHEGQAAKLYFAALAALLPPPWQFDGRNRHPPRDPFNALLSYGYAVLFQNVLTLLVRRGLNPCVGVLHALRDGHAALASDLMEEFRALVVDTVVLRMIMRSALHLPDFEQGDANCPCRLGHEARHRYLHALENRLDSPLTDPANGQMLDYRRAIESQVALYAEVVTGRTPRYTAFTQR
jgi:CRISPR-associated protein Cas1